jgi:hypothetical protein
LTPDCELMPACPFFKDAFSGVPEVTERFKEEYCRGEYSWCGRYMHFKAQEREMKRKVPGFTKNVTKSSRK